MQPRGCNGAAYDSFILYAKQLNILTDLLVEITNIAKSKCFTRGYDIPSTTADATDGF